MNELKKDQEEKVVGTLLTSPEYLDSVPYLIPDYFEDEGAMFIFSKILELREDNKEITALSVYKAIGDDEYIDYISRLSSDPVGKRLFNRYAKDIYESGKKKYLKEKITEITETSENPDEEIASVLDKMKVKEDVERDYFTETLEKLQWKMNHPNAIYGIKSGIEKFDELTNGFNNGGLYICAGRSSMGKSAFMTSVVSSIEKECGVGIISLEMTATELINRVACIRTKIPYWIIDRGRANNTQFDSFAESVMSLKKLYIDDRGGLTCAQVCAKIRVMVTQNNCKIVFVDHCGLIKVSDKGNLAHEIGKTTSALKSLAKELNIPIVLLCQVNRGVEGEKDKRPRLSDLRDSGRIEEDADCVFFMYRDEYYNPTSDKTRYEKAEVLVLKNRNGACGIINCVFDNQLMKFYEG